MSGATTTKRGRRGAALALTLALVGGYAADVRSGQRDAARRGEALGREATALATCVLGARGLADPDWGRAAREHLQLQAPGEAPLAACVPVLDRMEALRMELSGTRHRRSGEVAAQLAAASRALLAFPLDAPALDLFRRADALGSALRSLVTGACEAARREGSACPPAPARAPLASRVVLDAPGAGPVAWSAAARDGDVSVRLAAGDAAWEVRSLDAAQSFEPWLLPGSAPSPAGPPELVTQGGHAVVRESYGDPGYRGVILAGPQAPEPIGKLPALPAGHAPPPLGARALRTPAGWVTVGRDASGRGGLVAGAAPARAAPAGELLGAFNERGARLLLKRRSASGFLELVTVPVPAGDEPWGPEVSTVVPYVPDVAVAPGPEQACGLPGERYPTVVGWQGEEAVLAALAPKNTYAYRFHASAGARYSVVCGGCPPMALEARPDGLGLFLPVRRSLMPARIQAPISFDRERSPASARAACTATELALVYEAGGKVLAQRREQGWSFGPPVVVAEADERGVPVEPAIVDVAGHLVVLWRREAPGRLRIEALTL